LLRMTLMAMALTLVLCGSALAAERSLDAGFYDIGTATNVTVTAMEDGTTKAPAVTATIGSGTAIYYEGAERLAVTYSDAKAGSQYLVMLVEGDQLPTVDNAIWYIDQVAGSSGSIKFDVYPTLSDKSAQQLSLYITSNQDGFETKKIGLKYAPANTYTEAPYVLGDVDTKNGINATDASLVLQFAASLIDFSETQKLAANVDLKYGVNASDASGILQYAASLIKDFTEIQ